MAQALYASFADVAQAERAAGALLDHGLRNEDISLVTRREQAEAAQPSHGVVDPTGASAPTHVPDTIDTAGSPVLAQGGTGGMGGGPSGVSPIDMSMGYGGVASQRGDVAPTGVAGTSAADTAPAYSGPGADASGAEDLLARDEPPLAGYGHRWLDEPERNNLLERENVRVETDGGTQAASAGTAGDGDLSAKTGISVTTPEDAGAGAVKGTVVGLGLGAAAALASVFIPGVGLVLGGGALASVLGGTALAAGAGAAAGAVAGYLKDQGVPEEYVSRYDAAVQGGGAVLAVHDSTGQHEAAVRDILSKYGARDISAA